MRTLPSWAVLPAVILGSVLTYLLIGIIVKIGSWGGSVILVAGLLVCLVLAAIFLAQCITEADIPKYFKGLWGKAIDTFEVVEAAQAEDDWPYLAELHADYLRDDLDSPEREYQRACNNRNNIVAVASALIFLLTLGGITVLYISLSRTNLPWWLSVAAALALLTAGKYVIPAAIRTFGNWFKEYYPEPKPEEFEDN